VLKRLEEMGVLARIEVLSCVSGGSIVGGLYALRCAETASGAPGGYPVDGLIADLRPVLTSNLRGTALFGSPWRVLRALASFVSRRVSRIGLVVAELDRRLYREAVLRRLPPWVLLNATNLATGRAWKFFADRAGDYFAGATERTDHIRVAEAVAASAAYPGLTDSYGFATRWEELRSDLLDSNRWERPVELPGMVSRWRMLYGRASGPVVFPLVDGGLYDNEGANGLRGHKVTHAILSGATPAESDTPAGFAPRRWLRLVEVMHARLGAATRQLTHEMTHGRHPGEVALCARELGREIGELARDPDLSVAVQRRLRDLAERADSLVAVGVPARGHQFTASAQVLLHQTLLARNAYAPERDGGVNVPQECRGLTEALVIELSRVRTDLDALEPEVLDLLIAQGYFATDAVVKAFMPDLVGHLSRGASWHDGDAAPTWSLAVGAVERANANAAATTRLLTQAAVRRVLGRPASQSDFWRMLTNLVIGFALASAGVVGFAWFVAIAVSEVIRLLR
jgi:predicted acylesterase/phospholipase RssA